MYIKINDEEIYGFVKKLCLNKLTKTNHALLTCHSLQQSIPNYLE